MPGPDISGLNAKTVGKYFRKLSGQHESAVIRSFRAALGVDVSVLLDDGPIQQALHARVQTNVDLIKTIPSKFHSQLTNDLQRQLKAGPFDRQAVTRLLRTSYHSSGYNLRRLARDQTTKSIGQFTELRQKQIGIEKYRWSASDDNRVRLTHQINDGDIFEWANPPAITGPPGWDIQCRCVAVAIIPDKTAQEVSANALENKIAPGAPPGTSALVRNQMAARADELGLPAAQRGVDAAELAKREVDSRIVAHNDKIGEILAEYEAVLLAGDRGAAHRAILAQINQRKVLLQQARTPLYKEREEFVKLYYDRKREVARLEKELREYSLGLLAHDEAGYSFLATGEFSNSLNSADWEKLREGIGFLSRMVATGDEAILRDVVVRKISGRAFALNREASGRAAMIAIEGAAEELSTIVHELGHVMEYADKELFDDALAFLFRRTKGEKLQRLKDIYPDYNYAAKERCRPDAFSDAYVGRSYSYTGSRKVTNEVTNPWTGKSLVSSTEVVSMGLDFMARNPYRFMLDDPEYFDFIFEKVLRRYARAVEVVVDRSAADLDNFILNVISEAGDNIEGVGAGDDALRLFAEFRWGEQKATVVSGADFAAVDSPLLLRGMNEVQHVMDNVEGRFVGRGIFGNGGYYGSERSLKTSFQYSRSNDGHVFAAKLRPGSRIASKSELDDLHLAWRRENLDAGSRTFMDDIGRYAAREGYDAIKVDSNDFVVVLNNKALVVDERSLPGAAFSDEAEFWHIEDLRESVVSLQSATDALISQRAGASAERA